MTDARDYALALSGGGFRATLFHTGALIRLNECGLLPRLDRISSVSGGSIAAGRLAVVWDGLAFGNGVASNFREQVVVPLKAFCDKHVDHRAIAEGAVSPFKSVGDVLAGIYAEELLEKKKLQDLPDQPRFVFNATNLRTGRLFRFSKPYMADYRIGKVVAPDIDLGRVVASSSAFPPVLSPVTIDTTGLNWVETEGADLFASPGQRGTLQLTDGGAYDNLGLETVDDFKTILVSDAGAPFDVADGGGVGWLAQPMRALDIATDQARGLRKRLLFERARGSGQTIGFWGIDTKIDAYPKQSSLATNPAITGTLAGLRTRLSPFTPEEQGRLINWGYVLADAALRSYVPGTYPQSQLPEPQYPI